MGLTEVRLTSIFPISCVHSEIIVEEIEEKVFVSCNDEIKWIWGTKGTMMSGNKSMNLGKRILDPRGVYQCNETEVDGNTKEQSFKISSVQIYYRMCQSCVELDTVTLAGILAADIIATLLLALGVYCFAGHESGRLSGALPMDDTQALLRDNQLYQPLRHRNDDPYSHLGENWHGHKPVLQLPTTACCRCF
ncbi:T-cell surface glycoprotein CD3 delta chain [Suncus etruscus]|uniref:T-cell surface glycoprotein CD3 delta chain n=1 Tax=Suncus etruscus TaxID=109475 RepID=UPI00210F74E6|nr:T-cell surface glycoprotein CD3 delta chain [Suncus etruscus]